MFEPEITPTQPSPIEGEGLLSHKTLKGTILALQPLESGEYPQRLDKFFP